MKQQPSNIREELRSVGASDSEINELSALASNLKQLKSSKIKSVKAKSSEKKKSRWQKLWPIGLTAVAGLALGMALIIISQTVLPSSWLYPVQKISDNISMSLDPSYRGAVMMRRAQEVKQLIAENASSKIVLSTLSDYQSEASAYKSVSANYAVFEYCKANLQQAANVAPSSERQAINQTLSSLDNV